MAIVALLVWALPVLREGGRLAPLPLAAGLLLGATLFTLAGFLAVARYSSVNEYLFPSTLYMGLLMLPLFPYFGLGRGDWFYWHPMQAPLMLLRAAFEPIAVWQLAYGLLYGALWLAPLSLASRRLFVRFVVEKEGVR